jgi:hypothetical protein
MKINFTMTILCPLFVCLLLGIVEIQAADGKESSQALTEEGRALIGKANQLIWKADPADPIARETSLAAARRLLKKSREKLQAAHDQNKTAYDVFPKFIPQDDDDYENRREAEVLYLSSQMDLAICSYTEAHGFQAGSKQFQDQLRAAADEFKTIHERYRSMVAGLYARLWQGKCLEEQNEIGKALGIYNELLAHPGRSNAMKKVQDMSLHFRMVCLNSDSRKDYQLVVNEAEQWTKDRDEKDASAVFLGIHFQNAKAHEKLAEQIETKYQLAKTQANENKQPPPADPAEDIKRHRQRALKSAKIVGESPSQDQAEAKALIRRIETALGI